MTPDRLTRDGTVSIAGLQMAHDQRNADTAPVTMADVIAWGENNRMKASGNDTRDLASINRMRALLKLPPFSVIPQRVAVQEPLPGPHEYEPKPVRVPFSMAANKPAARPVAPTITIEEPLPVATTPTVEPTSKPIERSMRGLVDALFDEMDEVRAGRGSEVRIKQITQISVRLTELLAVEVKYRKLALEADGMEKTRLKQIAGIKEIEG